MSIKPDQYMPFDGSAFFDACSALPDDVALKYLRIIWFYWSHKGCKGLLNDDTTLRAIARCELHDWTMVKQLLFSSGEFLTYEDGLWHQNRARKMYAVQSALLAQKKAQTDAARKARWGK